MKRSAPKRRASKQKVKVAPMRQRRVKKLSCSKKQLNLPAGYKADGTTMVTLREMLDPKIDTTTSCAELTREQLVKLVAKRIEQQRKFSIAMVGEGVINKKRAIAEVKARTKIGIILTEIEQRVINNQIERAKTAHC